MGNLRRQQASPQSVAATEREEQALELRRGGMSYRQIAKVIGVSPEAAHKAVQRGIARQITRCEDKAADVWQLEMDRLDSLLEAIWSEAMQGNAHIIDRVLRIMERRAALTGIDKPTKIAPTNPDGTALSKEHRDAIVAAALATADA